MIILNEERYAKELIEKKEINNARDINVLAKYFFLEKEMTECQIVKEITENYLNHFDTEYCENEMLREIRTKNVVHNTIKRRPRRQVELLKKSLVYTQYELDYISSFKSLNWQKILFVLFAFKKLYNNSFFFRKSEIIKFAKLPENSQSYVEKILTEMEDMGILEVGIYECNYKSTYNYCGGTEIRYHLSDKVKRETTYNEIDDLGKTTGTIVIDADVLNDDFILYYLDYIGKAKVGYCQECGGIFEQSRNGKIKLCRHCKEKLKK